MSKRGGCLQGVVALEVFAYQVRPQGVHILSNLCMVTRPFHQLSSKHIVITFSGLLKEKNLETYDDFVSHKLLITAFGTIYTKETWLICYSRWNCLNFFQ